MGHTSGDLDETVRAGRRLDRLSDDLGRFACPYCGADNRLGELICSRCGRTLPRSSAELREEVYRRLEAERRSQARRDLAIAIAVGVAMAVGIRLIAETVPQDIVGMDTLVQLARLLWWLAGAIWGVFVYLALRSGKT